jgi:hypothetical protein
MFSTRHFSHRALYNILIEIGISIKLFRLIKKCLNEQQSLHRQTFVRYVSHYEQFETRCSVTVALEYVIRKVQADQEGMKLNDAHQLLMHADAVNILGGNTHTMKIKLLKWIFGEWDWEV